MRDFFKFVNNEILDSIDMFLPDIIIDEDSKNYYMSKSSDEHYRLLQYISNQFENSTIIDIGTYKGCSALALSSNVTNKIYSFDLTNSLGLKYNPENIEFILADITNGYFDNIILDSKFILLDTQHDGTFEKRFLDYLYKLNYLGVVMFDDIYLNQNMIQFWNGITKSKIDITPIGHATGSGIVFFD